MFTNAWRGMKPGLATVQDVTTAIGKPDREADGVNYGSVKGLHLLTYDDLSASLFLRNSRLFLIVLVPKVGGEFPTRAADWESDLGKPARKLPSIRGKNQRIHVYSGDGLTATTDADRVTLVEVFSPMTPDEYERTLYKVPPVFVK